MNYKVFRLLVFCGIILDCFLAHYFLSRLAFSLSMASNDCIVFLKVNKIDHLYIIVFWGSTWERPSFVVSALADVFQSWLKSSSLLILYACINQHLLIDTLTHILTTSIENGIQYKTQKEQLVIFLFFGGFGFFGFNGQKIFSFLALFRMAAPANPIVFNYLLCSMCITFKILLLVHM